jgi:hypothetical protein
MQQHITKLESLALQMVECNCGPSDEDICLTLLRSLPLEYESLVQATCMSDTKLNAAV